MIVAELVVFSRTVSSLWFNVAFHGSVCAALFHFPIAAKREARGGYSVKQSQVGIYRLSRPGLNIYSSVLSALLNASLFGAGCNAFTDSALLPGDSQRAAQSESTYTLG
jgi:hypothetical protein